MVILPGRMIREVSIELPSGEGKELLSTRVICVPENEGRVARERAVERPKTPDPIMRMDVGGVKDWEGEGGEGEGEDILVSLLSRRVGECVVIVGLSDCNSDSRMI